MLNILIDVRIIFLILTLLVKSLYKYYLNINELF